MVLVTGPDRLGQDHDALRRALARSRPRRTRSSRSRTRSSTSCKGITQIPVNEKKGLTFARGLRSILRHDPDKIMVGEIRDAETADIAIQSALTGHLVFTTVHANNVIDVLGRFLNMKIEPYNFVSALNCVQAQRLVRTICAHCKREVRASRELLVESGLDPKAYADVPFYEGAGCLECGGTGYKGRTAICELLDVTDTIRELILVAALERRDQARGAGGGHDLPARVGGVEGAGRQDHAAGDQQGHVRGGGVRRAAARGCSSTREPPLVAVEVRPRASASCASWREGGAPALRRGRVARAARGRAAPVDDRAQHGRRRPPSGRRCAPSLERAGVLGGARVALVLPDPVARIALLPAAEVKGRGAAEVEELIRFRLRKAVPFEVQDARVGVPARGRRRRLVAVAALRARARRVRGGVPRPGPRAGAGRAERAWRCSKPSRPRGPRADRLLVNWDDGYVSIFLVRDGALGPGPDADRGAAAEPAAGARARSRTRSSTIASGSAAGALGAAVVRSAALPPPDAAAAPRELAGAPVEILDPRAPRRRALRRSAQELAGRCGVAAREGRVRRPANLAAGPSRNERLPGAAASALGLLALWRSRSSTPAGAPPASGSDLGAPCRGRSPRDARWRSCAPTGRRCAGPAPDKASLARWIARQGHGGSALVRAGPRSSARLEKTVPRACGSCPSAPAGRRAGCASAFAPGADQRGRLRAGPGARGQPEFDEVYPLSKQATPAAAAAYRVRATRCSTASRRRRP